MSYLRTNSGICWDHDIEKRTEGACKGIKDTSWLFMTQFFNERLCWGYLALMLWTASFVYPNVITDTEISCLTDCAKCHCQTSVAIRMALHQGHAWLLLAFWCFTWSAKTSREALPYRRQSKVTYQTARHMPLNTYEQKNDLSQC